MTIILSQGSSAPRRLEPAPPRQEDFLQQYIFEHPEVLPVDEIQEGLELMVIAREFPTASGPIDVLAVDGEGVLYLIETKLYKNPDKRHVVAQVLDYGAALWRHSGDGSLLLRQIDQQMEKRSGGSLIAALAERFLLTESDALEVAEQVRQNLVAGRLRFVVLMDQLHEALRDLVLFLNQRSSFDLYAVEMVFYQEGDLQIVIPKLFGAEAPKRVGGSSRGRRTWDQDSFRKDGQKRGLSSEQIKLLDQLHQHGQQVGTIRWGGGSTVGSFHLHLEGLSDKLLSVESNGKLFLMLLRPEMAEGEQRRRRRFIQRLQREGIMDEGPLDDRTSMAIPIERWQAHLPLLVEAIKESAHDG